MMRQEVKRVRLVAEVTLWNSLPVLASRYSIVLHYSDHHRSGKVRHLEIISIIIRAVYKAQDHLRSTSSCLKTCNLILADGQY